MQRISRVKSLITRPGAGEGVGMDGDAVARVVVRTRRCEGAFDTFLRFVNGRDAREATGHPSRRANDTPAGADNERYARLQFEVPGGGTMHVHVPARRARMR